MRQEEKSEQEATDARAAQSLQEEEDEYEDLPPIITTDSIVNMTVYLFDEARTIHFQSYELERMRGGMRFSLSEQNTQNIVDALRNTDSSSMRVTMHSRSTHGVPVELANTPVLPTDSFYTGEVDLVIELPESSVYFMMNAEGGLGQIQFETMQ
jgi:hypothetical protein